ncbi:hypothetical protein ACTJJ0_31160 [Chitinophaga sp. 22321]|uniref:DUF4625 domain-containing protein n=1 Tax=Chitinophaga hostae TaxID=2831022 RepID=A0ABS5JAS6_9BACT|nr:hypothetical protein [Chitinophaga hostae]MBS0031542.1 hypothetical protein [Chitinophaga hostae]
MKKILFLSLLVGLFYACKKDKIGTKPILSFKSYSLDSVTVNTDQMVVTINVEDGDGDIEDTLSIAPIIDSHAPDTAFLYKKMPSIGANRGNRVKAEVQILLENSDIKFGNYPPIPKDSIHFEIYIRDNAGNVSDTIFTPKIPYKVS